MANRRGERGQSTPLVMSVLFALTLFTAVVVDVGQAVNRRIALQIVADTGAFTGASSMAVGLNNIAYWNGLIQKFWAPVTWVTFNFTATPVPCGVTDAVAEGYDIAHTILGAFIKTVNYGYVAKPNEEATRVSNYNAADLFPGEQLTYAEYDMFNPEVPIWPKRTMPPLYPIEEVPDFSPNYAAKLFGIPLSGPARSFTVWECTTVPPDLPVRVHRFDKWYQKSTDDVKYFVWIVKAPPTKAILFNDFFTALGLGDAIPEMTAVAAAKPVGGSIEEADSSYVAKMVPMSKVMPSLGPIAGIYDTVVRTGRFVWH